MQEAVPSEAAADDDAWCLPIVVCAYGVLGASPTGRGRETEQRA